MVDFMGVSLGQFARAISLATRTVISALRFIEAGSLGQSVVTRAFSPRGHRIPPSP